MIANPEAIIENQLVTVTINGKKFEWSEHDIFCVPSWAWHEHANGSKTEDACLFCLNDLPVMRSLGLYREEAYGENNGSQPLFEDKK